MISLKESILSGRQQSIDTNIIDINSQQIRDAIIDILATNSIGAFRHEQGDFTELVYKFKSEEDMKEIMSKTLKRLNSVLVNVKLKSIDDQIVLVCNKFKGLPVSVISHYGVPKDTCVILSPYFKGKNSFITVLLSEEIL